MKSHNRKHETRIIVSILVKYRNVITSLCAAVNFNSSLFCSNKFNRIKQLCSFYIIFFCAATLHSEGTKIVGAHVEQCNTEELYCLNVWKEKCYEICNITPRIVFQSVPFPS